MTPKSQKNRLLARLAPKDLDALRPHLTGIPLPLRFSLEKRKRPIDYVYFPESGIASVVSIQANDVRVEVGLIGSEGMSGMAVLLGNHQTPNVTYMQVAGAGHRMSADSLRAVMAKNAGVQALMLKYVQAFMVQISQTAICNAHNHIDRRLARWILMAHDRCAGDFIPLTHEFLSLMLGVRRAGVTQALHALATRGLIKSVRGKITVLDRAGLEESAGDAYGVPEAEYRRLFGAPLN
jgi:CRP-like cAMP-binding protein